MFVRLQFFFVCLCVDLGLYLIWTKKVVSVSPGNYPHSKMQGSSTFPYCMSFGEYFSVHRCTETTVCSLLMLQHFPKPKPDPSLFNPAHERLCDDKYLLRKGTVEMAFIIYGSDRL